MSNERVVRDSMGEMRVPGDALYGASTARAVENFPISGRTVGVRMIRSYALLKECCAEVNRELGRLTERRAALIVGACREIRGALGSGETASDMMRHFPVDVFQTGSGTSTNMNVNEVISTLACLAAGADAGAQDPVHPNDHVNLGQSSNDTFPTAMQLAAALAVHEELSPALGRLAAALRRKAREWDGIVKTGRTHLMDATPVRMDQVFGGFASQVEQGMERAERVVRRLAGDLPIGGTAVGTGLNTHPGFGGRVAAKLAGRTGIGCRETRDHFAAQSSRDGVVEASGQLRTIAVSLGKIANDLRLMGSGPRCGLNELRLPAVQPGSSIMPGKVNPVLCETVIQVVCQVVGHDAAIAMGAAGGVGSLLELNVAMPMMAENLLSSIGLLASASGVFAARCVDGLELDREAVEEAAARSLMSVTRLVPEIGHDRAAELAETAFRSGRTIREVALESGLFEEGRLDRLLDPRSQTGPSPAD